MKICFMRGAIAAAFTISLMAAASAAEFGLATNLPLTGSWANYGVGMENSFQLAIDQANASGAMGSNRLKVIPGDNAGTATQGVNLATKAGDDATIMGAFCCWASEIGIATHSIYQRYNLPVILGGSNDHRSSRPFHSDAVVFRNSPYDLINMKFAAIYAAQVAHFKRIYLIDDGSAFGRTQVDEFAKVVEEKVGKDAIIGRESIAQGEKDFTPLLTTIKPLNPDMVYFGGRIIEASLMRQQMVRLGLAAPLMTSEEVFPTPTSRSRAIRQKARLQVSGDCRWPTILRVADRPSRKPTLMQSSAIHTRRSGRWPSRRAKSTLKRSPRLRRMAR